ncbi:Gfo/Idh/MocA family protein [Eubacterium sp.]|uniref:Gfo/Idh/MocA family protein n=1 Tax=Eubacterium sp. TaxID=142586 RepID=UPI003522F2EF
MKKLKVGVIGCGNIFPMHAKSILLTEKAEVIAVCDVNEKRAISKATEYKCKYYTDYEKMIEESKLDIVHICTPHYLHLPMTVKLASHGINVITEKPIALNSNDAKYMIDTCKDNNVYLGIIFQNRYNPGSVLVKNALQTGKLGKTFSCRLIITWKRTDEYYKSTNWKGTLDKEGGGVIIDQAIHSLDLIRWFVDDEVEYVDCSMGTRQHDSIEVEDYAEGYIKFRNNVFASFYTMNYNSYDAPIQIELHCEKGIATVVGDSAEIEYADGTKEYADVKPEEFIDFGEGAKSYWGTSHAKQINDFYEKIIDKKLELNGKEAVKTQMLIDAIYKAGKSKKRVFLNDDKE